MLSKEASEVVWQHLTEIRRTYYSKMPRMPSTTSMEEESIGQTKIWFAKVKADLDHIRVSENLGDAGIFTGLKLWCLPPRVKSLERNIWSSAGRYIEPGCDLNVQ